MPDWNPELYLKFGPERTRPALDLALRALALRERTLMGGPSAAAALSAAPADRAAPERPARRCRSST